MLCNDLSIIAVTKKLEGLSESMHQWNILDVEKRKHLLSLSKELKKGKEGFRTIVSFGTQMSITEHSQKFFEDRN